MYGVMINSDLFQLLENDISIYSEYGDVFIAGDFNARVGNKPDFIVNDVSNSFCDLDEYIADSPHVRTSVDNVHNSHGLKMLDLCKSLSVRIVNSRIGQSCNHTFFSRNGLSIIDYLLTHEKNFSLLKHFSVDPFNEWSDHAPLCFVLNCKKHNA